MERFFDTVAKVLVEHDAIVDKFVGDEVIGIFVPALAGEVHAARTIEAARVLLTRTGNAGDAPSVPIGAGVHAGIAFVQSIGSGPHVELTVMGDTVNVTARLASAAGAGEILVTVQAVSAAGFDDVVSDRRELALRGISKPVSVVVMRARKEAAAGSCPGVATLMADARLTKRRLRCPLRLEGGSRREHGGTRAPHRVIAAFVRLTRKREGIGRPSGQSDSVGR